MGAYGLVRLSELSSQDRASYGGKATHLAFLWRAGLPIPAGFALPVEAFVRFANHNGLQTTLDQTLAREGDSQVDLEAHLDRIRLAIEAGNFPVRLVADLENMYESLLDQQRCSTVAVRSSSCTEDSSEASFAGQYLSTLNVQGFEHLKVAVKKGWASFFEPRAVEYRRRQRVGDQFDLGLVVQEMIDPLASGVLFTRNPLTGSRQEMILEAGFGLGEAFVSGQLCPDSFTLSRPLFPWTLARVAVRRRQVEVKTRMLTCIPAGSGRLAMVDVPEELRCQPAVKDKDALLLGRLGLQSERLFGVPLDIEWVLNHSGRILILQARPITAMLRRSHQRRNGMLWTQRFSGERWTEPATTLGWSIMEPILEHFIHFDRVAERYLQGSPPTRIIGGYPYFNITIFRHLLWKVPGFAAPQFILEFFPKSEQEELLASDYVIPNFRLVSSIVGQVYRERRWERYHWNFLTNHDAWEEFLPEFERIVGAISEKNSDAVDARKAVRLGEYWIREYIKIHLLSLLFANIYYQLLAGLLRRWLGQGGDTLLSELVAEPAANKTMQTNRDLWALASMVRNYPAMRKCFEETPPPTRERLKNINGFVQFDVEFQHFLEKHGHRSTASWEIFSQRWCEAPDLVLQMVQKLVLEEDPGVTESARTEAQKVAERHVLKALGRWRPGKRRFVLHVLNATQRYMTLRENQRYYFDKLLLKMKRALEDLSEHLVMDERLSASEDITLLSIGEIDDILANRLGGRDLEILLVERRSTRGKNLAVEHPVFVEGESGSCGEDLPLGRRLTGLGISPGRITGTVRIIRQLKEMHKLRRGDILVTRATDPGWTPLFLTAGGLVTELGSLLSHGAVIAREYNLPAVVNISGATRVLKDGQQITLDGSRGLVYLH